MILLGIFYSIMQTAEVPQSQPEEKKEYLQEDSKFSMFQSVISKYFEIIKSIMPKLTSLSLENEEFQKMIFMLENKMAKIEKDQENLHYEVRSNHITIDSKLNNILSEYTNITTQNAKIKKQNEELTRQFKIHHSNERQSILNQALQFQSTPPPQSPAAKEEKEEETSCKEPEIEEQKKESKEKRNFLKNKGKKITFNQEVINRSSKEKLNKRNGKIMTSRSKNSLSIEQDESSSEMPEKMGSSQYEQFNSEKMLELTEKRIVKSMKSQKIMLRKGTQKSLTKFSGAQNKKGLHQSQSHKVILDNKRQDYLQASKFDQILQQIENFHRNNQQIKNNYQELMSDYCKTTQDQFNRVDQQIKDIRSKLAELDYVHVHIEKIKLLLESKISNVVREFDSKIERKVDKFQYKEFLVEINQRISTIHEERKKVANKEQTKKAIEFLENKLNMIYQSFGENEKPPKLHLVDLEADTFKRTSGQSHLSQRPSFIQEGRASKFCPARPSHIFGSSHEHRPSANLLDSGAPTKRQGESLHSRFKNEQRFNEDLTEFRMHSLQKATTDQTKTIRKKSNPKQTINLNALKQKSLDLLSKDKPKARNKLKKEPLIFQYDN